MRVLVYTTLYPNSEQTELGSFVEKRLLELRKRGEIDVQVVAPVPWFPFDVKWAKTYRKFSRIPGTEVRAGITVHHPRYLVIPKLGWRFAPLFLMFASFGTIRGIRNAGFNFQLIDGHFVFPDGVAAQLLGSIFGVPVCLTARGSDINDSANYAIPKACIKWALKRAEFIVAVSEDLARKIRQLTGPDLDLEVLQNGVDLSIFYPRDAEPLKSQLRLRKRVVLSVGNLRKLKGHEILIRAVEGIREVSLLIVGTGEELDPLKRLIGTLGSDVDVRFLGTIANDELPVYYSIADVFALASSNEGCPNVVLESIACGTPVVATTVGAIPELVPETCHQFLVHERTVDAFRETLNCCLDDPPDREVLLTRARQLSWDHTCDSLLKKLDNVLINWPRNPI